MKTRIVIATFFILIAASGTSQQKWNLKSVVEYAMANNITVKMSEVQARIAGLTYKQSLLSMIPSLDLGNNVTFNSGSTQNPVTFERVTQSYISSGFQLQSSADIFNFFSKRNTIQANKWEMEASIANVEKNKNDIALTAANGYLQVLLAKEQQNVTLLQLQQTRSQFENTRKQVDAGALPELNASQLDAQLALDSVNYITAKGDFAQAVLLLKSYMNIDAAAPFEVETPPVESIPVDAIADLQPENVYQLAMTNQPLQKYNELRLKAAEKFKAASKGMMYPSISAFGNLRTNYANLSYPNLVPSNVYRSTDEVVSVGGVPYNVLTPVRVQDGFLYPPAFGTQFSENFQQGVGLSLNVPLFNGYQRTTNYLKSKLNITTLQLQKAQDDQTLKQDIYQAYNAAVVALEKFNASKKNMDINEITYNYASKRFDVGMLSTFDLITTQNNLLRARLEYTINRFDYVFKMKVLEFYKGQGLRCREKVEVESLELRV